MHIINQPLKCLETFADLSSHVLKTITSNDSDHVVFLTDQSWKNESEVMKQTDEYVQDLFL